MLARHPNNLYPDFWPTQRERAHLYFDYYEHRLSETKIYFLCRSCFLAVCKPSEADSEFSYTDYWDGMSWQFSNVKHHFTVKPKTFVTHFLKIRQHWCDRCVLTPLFKLYDWETCTEETTVHKYTADDDDSDPDSDIETFTRTEMTDPYLPESSGEESE